MSIMQSWINQFHAKISFAVNDKIITKVQCVVEKLPLRENN